MRKRIILIGAFVGLGILLFLAWRLPAASAETTVPQRYVYNGHLLDTNGDALTTAHNVRFSFWTSTDYLSGDVTATGAINTGASNYASWQEVHTVTPDSSGYFTVEMGSGTALPDFSSMSPDTLVNLHLQVEVKAATAANTAYELLDRNSSDDTLDRSPLRSVPFATNADLLDRREIGTGSGSIPLLQSGGMLNVDTMPTAVDHDTFTLDYDNTVGTGSISLQFGQSLGKKLSFDNTNTYFNFNDDVNIQGNLTVNLINGIDITSLVSDTNVHLKVSSGAGLAINVAGGGYRLGGNTTQFAGTTSSVSDETTNYVFFTSTGLVVTDSGFPSDKMFLPLATVVATGGGITSISDRRVFNSNDTERTVERVFQPEFEGAAYQGDGSNNVGRLLVNHTGSLLTNYYQWTSTRGSLQDYDVLLRVRLPADFVRWGSNPLTVSYRSTSADSADNQMNVSVYDTDDAQVTLSGSSLNLASATWTTTQLEYTGTPTWTAGDDLLVKLSLSAKNNEEMHLGFVKLQYVELLSE